MTDMLDYLFISKLDQFVIILGKLPILITGDHAYCKLSEYEKTQHLCDFAVSPFLEKISEYNLFNIIENQTLRSVIDMNRLEARLSDLDDKNDYYYRQAIRFMLRIITKNHGKKPIVIDLHSYPKNDRHWGKYDLMVLEQTRRKMETNPALLRHTITFFRERGYDINSTTQHNQDDVVEEIQLKNLGYPILIEINEKFIYLVELDMKNRKNPKRLELDSLNQSLFKFNPSKIQKYFKMISDGINNTKNINNFLLRTEFRDYLYLNNLILDSSAKERTQGIKISENDFKGSFESFYELNENISKISQAGHNDEQIIKSSIISYSNEHDTIIIPIEVIVLYVKILYNNINKSEFQEWGIMENSLVAGFLELNFKNNLGLSTPRFSKNPQELYNLITQSYLIEDPSMKEGYFISFAILFSNMKNIKKNHLEKDLETLNNWFKLQNKFFSKDGINKFVKNKKGISALRNYIEDRIF
jgi:hypothetical protein